MRTLTSVAVILVAFTGVCSAALIQVTMSGDYDAQFLGLAWPYEAQHFSISFVTDQTPSGVVPQGDGNAFSIPITATYASGSLSVDLTGTAGWFHYPDDYMGLDVRLHPAGGGYLQSVVGLNVAPYTGTASDPTLVLMDVAGWFVLGYWYPAEGLATFASATNGHYTAAASEIPEPSTAVLVGLALAVVGAFRRTRLRAIVGRNPLPGEAFPS